ncbi:hypothetical protein [Photobacterium indicum]|uniref:Uncharacterized protein n=1 Tax=Photobacterium indicum TaxID=81447 RepID=A0A2T3LED0_9GAMM|nr:hypothetical protein [Photobacterium indicum]PSV49737.1 hypothetical protein C9J47_04015 [Photobacterium indicum]
MNIFIGGNPLTKKEDDTVIYTQPKFMPPLSQLKSFPKLKKSEVPSFVENIYFLTMERNGFSYFYPNTETGVNLCRFEWHHEYQENPYELRIGLSFKVFKGSLQDVGFYIVPHAHYENLEERVSYEIDSEEYSRIIESIDDIVLEALSRSKSQETTTFNVLYYVELSSIFTEVIKLNNNISVLPSRLVEGKIVSAIVIEENGHSYLSAKRFSDEKVNFLCAIMSLALHKAKITHIERFPSHITPVDKPFSLSVDNIEKFYPETSSSVSGTSNKITSEEVEFISSVLLSVNSLSCAKSNRKLKNILFSFYSAKETEGVNQTVGLVSYVACLDAIAKEISSTTRDEHGSRKALVQTIVQLLTKSHEECNVDKWSKRIYNDHRSSYVHGANIKFEAFSQNMDGKNFAGLPNALPTESKPVSKQYEYNADYIILKRATLAVLIKYIETVTDSSFPDVFSIDEIAFKIESTPEAHVSTPNNGWVRLT